ncbi:MAG: VCBS repeat-containing protein [Clostridiales Family XIII bacterium]|jgi:hypothetical protein|nr:VCBS repeat-containing protein [Clostridiales Family XIII bacterium]
MKIESYAVQAASDWKFRSEDIEIRSVKQKTLDAAKSSVDHTADRDAPRSITLDLSEDAKKLIQSMKAASVEAEEKSRARTGRVSGCASSPENHALEIRMNILEMYLYRLTGKKFSFKSVSLDPGERPHTDRPPDFGYGNTVKTQIVTTEEEFFTSHYESESLRYEAKGMVKTADGRSISVDIGLSMSRQFYTYMTGSVSTTEVIKVVDPLIINFSGTAASLTERKFEFDIDADGMLDSISFAGEGSGFLAFDKNGDGVINDGSELFGPQSGSGFGELRAYDLDGNGWIDENDEIFSKLRVWSKGADGSDMLFTLKEADVGAIYLGDISTQYTLGSYGQTDGMLRSTSMFLKESGGAGLISHIDLAV